MKYRVLQVNEGGSLSVTLTIPEEQLEWGLLRDRRYDSPGDALADAQRLASAPWDCIVVACAA